MSKEEIIELLYSLPSDFLPLVEAVVKGQIPEEKFVWELQKAKGKSISDEQFSKTMKALGYQNFRGNEWSKDPDAIRTHELLRDVVFAITSAVGGMALKDAIDKSNNSNSIPSTSTPDVLGDKEPFVSDTSNIWDKISKGINSILDNTSQSFSNFGSNISQILGSLGTNWISSQWNMSNMKELIDYQNQYNTPANQMQRFQDAGLNPNLIYGLGSNGNQPASGSIAPVDFDTSQRENRLAKMQIQLQSKQVMADIAQKQAMVNFYNKQAEGVDIENQFNAQTLNDRVMTITANLQKMQNELDLQSKEINNWDEFRNVQLGLMQAQTYAAFLGSHSIYGKIVEEVKEHLTNISESLRKRFPQWADAFDYNDLPYDVRSNHPQNIPPGFNGR